MITSPEQRGFPRIATECGARYRVTGAQAARAAVIKNISAGGMLFIAADELDVGTTLELRVDPGQLSIPMLSAVVEVVRSAPARNEGTVMSDDALDSYEIGVRVLSVR
ncbi:MAG: PilZ domain-containing protein [Gammaproteobacteria bacterium]